MPEKRLQRHSINNNYFGVLPAVPVGKDVYLYDNTRKGKHYVERV